MHILHRGKLSRINDGNHHVDGLENHPHLKHHDLSSILMEGLPPLKEVIKKDFDPIEQIRYLRKRYPDIE